MPPDRPHGQRPRRGPKVPLAVQCSIQEGQPGSYKRKFSHSENWAKNLPAVWNYSYAARHIGSSHLALLVSGRIVLQGTSRAAPISPAHKASIVTHFIPGGLGRQSQGVRQGRARGLRGHFESACRSGSGGAGHRRQRESRRLRKWLVAALPHQQKWGPIPRIRWSPRRMIQPQAFNPTGVAMLNARRGPCRTALPASGKHSCRTVMGPGSSPTPGGSSQSIQGRRRYRCTPRPANLRTGFSAAEGNHPGYTSQKKT